MLRYHQAQWREANGHPIGSQPIAPRAGAQARSVGSRLPLAYARETGANFLTARALEAARARASLTEPHQSFDHQRLWADLLWSPALAVNLFGDLAADVDARRPGRPRVVAGCAGDRPRSPLHPLPRLARSRVPQQPARLRCRVRARPRRRRERDRRASTSKYHEWSKPEIPRPENVPRYLEVAEKSAAFAPGATAGLEGRSELAVMWLEHLLLLSMLQHPSGRWTWGRYVVVHPAGNSDIADACARYRSLLADDSTFASVTLEELLDVGVLPDDTTRALRARYLPDG